MKLSNANVIRKKYVDFLKNKLFEEGEDLGMITSNSFNFPVAENGEEGWVEIVVKVVKDDEGYEKREQYSDKLREKKEKKEKAEKAKAKKIEHDKKLREIKKREKEKRENKN